MSRTRSRGSVRQGIRRAVWQSVNSGDPSGPRYPLHSDFRFYRYRLRSLALAGRLPAGLHGPSLILQRHAWRPAGNCCAGGRSGSHATDREQFAAFGGIAALPPDASLRSPPRHVRHRCGSRRSAAGPQLHALANNLGNFMQTLALPKDLENWSLTTQREKLVKIGAKVVCHGRYVTFQLAEVSVSRSLFQQILELINDLRRRPVPA